MILEYRFADGKLDRLPELAAALVGSKVDVIVTRATGSIRVAMNASKTIPIFFPQQALRSRTDWLQAWR